MTVEERIAELRRVDLTAELGDERLRWIAEHVEDRVVGAGEDIFLEGDDATEFYFLLDGRVESLRRTEDGSHYNVAEHGQYTFVGAISLLAGIPYPGTTRAIAPTRVLALSADDFFDLVRDEPAVRRTVLQTFRPVFERWGRMEAQREKLTALGSLSAGLAHELNNPAAAAGRAARELSDALAAVQDGIGRLAAHGVSPEALRSLAATAAVARAAAADADELDALERSDREEELATALDEQGVREAWDLAPDLVGVGIDRDCATSVAATVGSGAAADALTWMAAGARAEAIAAQLADATDRISTLVGAVKEYTYMDQAPTQDVDVHKGIKTTLTVLAHKLKKGDVRIVKELAPDLPPINASGSELNQVWTNLLDNAIDAVDGDGTVTIRSHLDGDKVLIDIIDDGPGSPRTCSRGSSSRSSRPRTSAGERGSASTSSTGSCRATTATSASTRSPAGRGSASGCRSGAHDDRPPARAAARPELRHRGRGPPDRAPEPPQRRRLRVAAAVARRRAPPGRAPARPRGAAGGRRPLAPPARRRPPARAPHPRGLTRQRGQTPPSRFPADATKGSDPSVAFFR
jgi:signal transduction histidine kinase